MHLEIKIHSFSGDNNKKLFIDSGKCKNYEVSLARHVRVINNNCNIVNHSHYKSISGVQGSKRKIRPQKKMGRSRQGSIREIHMRGGGVKFGFSGDKETDRHMRYKRKLYINKKEKRLTQMFVFLNKCKNNLINIVDMSDADNKTKNAYTVISQIKSNKRCSFIFGKENILSIRNIKDLYIYRIDSMNVVNLLKHNNAIFTLNALENFLNKLKIKYTISDVNNKN